jgi:predicted dehydrogenase
MRPLRGAIIGYGFIAERGHLPAYLAPAGPGAGFRIVAVADVCPARRALVRRTLPHARVYHDATALLAAEGDGLDFVDIATPPAMHAPLAHAALDRGLHVLCEKPLATSAEDARAMIAHAVRAQRVLYPCHTYKHAPVIKAVRRALETGLVGRVHLVTLHTFRNTHARGVPEWNPDWRRDPHHAGGGIAMDHGSHTFYLAFDWLGDYPTAITAKMSAAEGQTNEDNFACAITFPRGMAIAHLTWTAGVRKVIYTLHGERGAVRVEDDDVEVATRRTPPGSDTVQWERRCERVPSAWMDASHAAWFRSLLEGFAAAIERGEYAGRDAQDAVRCIELITTAYASARDGSREQSLGERP